VLAAGFGSSFHGQAWSSSGKYQVAGCEACHGPGGKHAEEPSRASIISFGKQSAQTADERAGACLGCHAASKDLDFWGTGKHAANGVACADCHDTHASAVPKVNQPDVCFGCHQDIRLQANKQSHHPIIEGRVSCSDCHNPHGSLAHGMLRADTRNQLCYSCHAEKRGPFMWEHAPVEENCGTCHEAHGSRHNKLLTEKMPNLCQNCHNFGNHPGTPYDETMGFEGTGSLSSRNKFVARSCTNCHSNIHGSNAPGDFGKTFVR
jgi:DmsE family decaheme c-type cytochrome